MGQILKPFILALSPTALLVTRAVTVGGEGASGRAKEKDRFCGPGIMSFFFWMELCLAGVTAVVCLRSFACRPI